MKRFAILLILIVFSCNNVSNEKAYELLETEDLSAESNSGFEIEKPNFNELDIIEEKLQDLYDANYYKSKHPEFATDDSDGKSDIVGNLDNNVTISNLKPLSVLQPINDSIQSIIIEYSIISDGFENKDTINAFLNSKKVIIENETISTLEIHFSKEKINP